MTYIYKTTNLINGKIYVGKSSKDDDSYLGSGIIIREAIQKYGSQNFEREILEYCDDAVVDEREIFWIESLRAREREVGYNIAPGGFGGDTTSCHPNREEIIQKRADGLKSWHKSLSPEEKQNHAKKISESKKGKSNGREGYVHTQETIEKMKNNRPPITDDWIKSHAIAMSKRKGISLTKKFKKILVDGVMYESVKAAIAGLGLKHRKTFYDMIEKKMIKVEYL